MDNEKYKIFLRKALIFLWEDDDIQKSRVDMHFWSKIAYNFIIRLRKKDSFD